MYTCTVTRRKEHINHILIWTLVYSLTPINTYCIEHSAGSIFWKKFYFDCRLVFRKAQWYCNNCMSISICVCIIKCLNIQKHTEIQRYNFIECFVHIIITTIESVRIKEITKIWKRNKLVSRKKFNTCCQPSLVKELCFWTEMTEFYSRKSEKSAKNLKILTSNEKLQRDKLHSSVLFEF